MKPTVAQPRHDASTPRTLITTDRYYPPQKPIVKRGIARMRPASAVRGSTGRMLQGVVRAIARVPVCPWTASILPLDEDNSHAVSVGTHRDARSAAFAARKRAADSMRGRARACRSASAYRAA